MDVIINVSHDRAARIIILVLGSGRTIVVDGSKAAAFFDYLERHEVLIDDLVGLQIQVDVYESTTDVLFGIPQVEEGPW